MEAIHVVHNTPFSAVDSAPWPCAAPAVPNQVTYGLHCLKRTYLRHDLADSSLLVVALVASIARCPESSQLFRIYKSVERCVET